MQKVQVRVKKTWTVGEYEFPIEPENVNKPT